ncbi:MAG TPA: hypothetical protein VLW47_05310, partial [Thermodesulfobacteriota bacterium]|nr:hypothetical protein [Thermodesulfobacteriota bacterium]
MRRAFNKRNMGFVFLSLVAILMIYGPLRGLLRSEEDRELYSHILYIPLISAYFVYEKRKILFSDLEYSSLPGMILMAMGILFY